MSIIAFVNKDKKESGQTLSIAAIATSLAIDHNYKILLMSTDFDDSTMEDAFFAKQRVGISSMFAKSGNNDIANGLEGLIRMFASNRASGDIVNSYAKPILNDNRLDYLQPPKTKDYREYCNLSVYFSQIADVANSTYDLVLIDVCNKVPEETQKKIMEMSSLTVVGLIQNLKSINDFAILKQEDDFFRKSNVVISIGKYNPDSKYTAKNIGRMLREKNVPITVPYNVLYADNCTEGNILNYFLAMQGLTNRDGKDGYFCSEVKKTADKVDYLRQAQELGLNK